MKRGFLRRALGIMLAGMLIIENGVPTVAAVKGNDLNNIAVTKTVDNPETKGNSTTEESTEKNTEKGTTEETQQSTPETETEQSSDSETKTEESKTEETESKTEETESETEEDKTKETESETEEDKTKETESETEESKTEETESETEEDKDLVKELKIDKDELELNKGNSDNVMITIIPTDLKDDNKVDNKLECKSLNDKIATVEIIKDEETTEESTEKATEASNEEISSNEETSNEETSEEPASGEETKKDNKVKAIIRAIGAGETDIIFNAGKKQIKCHVKVTVPVEDIVFDIKDIENNSITISAYEEEKEIDIKLLPEDTTDSITQVSVKDEDILDCELKNGKLFIKSKNVIGKTEITVKAGNESKKLEVKIVDREKDTTSEVVPVNELKINAVYGTEDNEAKDAVNLVIGSNDSTLLFADLGLSVSPITVTDKNIKWESSDESVVTVEANESASSTTSSKWINYTNAARVTAKSLGKAVITAKASNGVTAKVNVVVNPANKKDVILNIPKSKIVLYSNEKLPSISGLASKESITPAGNYKYTYCSSNKDIATVDQNGEVTAHAPGQAVITVTAEETGSKGTVTVVVKNIADSINIPLDKIVLIEGATTKIPFTISPEDVSKECLNTLMVEKSKGSPIEIVGWTKGKNKGEITIKANKPDKITDKDAIVNITIGDSNVYNKIYGDTVRQEEETIVTAKKELVVDIISKNEFVDTISFTAKGIDTKTNTVKMKSGETLATKITIKDKEGNYLDATVRAVGYTSSKPEIAEVSPDGVITALKGGTVTISAKVLDGSNKSASFKVQIEQRPDSIVFAREVYGVNKTEGKSAEITLTPKFNPSSTSSECKKVKWEIISYGDDNNSSTSNKTVSEVIKLDGAKVKIGKKATDGMFAMIRCTSKADSNVYGEVKVRVQSKRVASVKYAKDTTEVMGLGVHELEFTTKYVKDCNEMADFTAYSSDEEIITVKSVREGLITYEVHKLGKAKITVCADNNATATCQVTVYSEQKGDMAAKKSNYYLQTYDNSKTDQVKLEFVNSKTKKLIDPSLLEYTSSNPSLVYIDDNGYAHANPANTEKVTKDNCQITVTAAIKDDVLKRKAKTKITLCVADQIERMDVKFYSSTSDLKSDNDNYGKGVYITDQDDNAIIKYENQEKTIGLRIIPYDADSNVIEKTGISITLSDPNVAELVAEPIQKAVGTGNKYKVWEAKVKILKAGSFSVNITSKDQKKLSRKVIISASSGEPVLSSNGLGTINKNSESSMFEAKPGVFVKGITTKNPFTLYPADGTEIEKVSIASITYKDSNGNTKQMDRSWFFIKELGNSQYSLVLRATDSNNRDLISKLGVREYKIKLNVQRTKFEFDNNDDFNEDFATSKITTTFKVSSSVPQLKNINTSLNTFVRGNAAKLPIESSITISDVRFVNDQEMNKYFEIYENPENGKWYIKAKDNKFKEYNKSSMSGKLEVYLEGYDEPSKINLKLTTTSTAPSIKQLTIPGVNLSYGKDTYITLVDSKNNKINNFKVDRKNPDKKATFDVSAQADGTIKATYTNQNMKLISQGNQYSEKVIITKDDWKKPVEITLKTKAYNDKSKPSVNFANTKLYINLMNSESSVVTEVVTNQSNMELKEGEWSIDNKKAADIFRAQYINGQLKVSLKNPATAVTGTYRFKMFYELKNADAEGAKTKELTVIVKKTAPTVEAKLSGKLDLVDANTYVQCKIKVSGVASEIKNISLGEGFENFKYEKVDDYTIKIRNINTAKIKVKEISGYINIEMSNRNIIKKKITFKPTQSVPKIADLPSKNVYKSASSQTVDFDFNGKLNSKGISIQKIESVSVPNGFNLQDDKGHLFVTLGNKAMKPGEYEIKVNVYFKGAAPVSGNELGKPVQKTIKVKVS